MRLTTFPATAVFGVLLVVASAAMAIQMRASRALQPDWKLSLEVKEALLEKLGTDGLDVGATCHRGAVTLGGTVGDRRTRETAGALTRSLAGVRSVDNGVELEVRDRPGAQGATAVDADGRLGDALLETRLRLALIRSMGNDGFHVGAGATGGVVTLSFDHDLRIIRRQRALIVARGLQGVARVVVVDRPAVARI